MIIENENQQVYVCKTDDKKKIYFSKVTESFGSVYHSEKKVSSGFLFTINILSYAYIRQFDDLILSGGYKTLGILLTTFFGILLGMIAGFLKRKRLNKKVIAMKRMRMDQQKLEHFLALADVELDQNQGAVFVLISFSVLSIILFYLWGTIYLLFGGMVLMSMGVFFLIDYNLKNRKKLYVKLKEMKIK